MLCYLCRCMRERVLCSVMLCYLCRCMRERVLCSVMFCYLCRCMREREREREAYIISKVIISLWVCTESKTALQIPPGCSLTCRDYCTLCANSQSSAAQCSGRRQ